MRTLLNKPWFVVTMSAAALVVVGHSLFPGHITPVSVFSRAAVGAAETAEAAPAAEAPPLSTRDALKALEIPVARRDPFVRGGPVEEVAKVKVTLPDSVETLVVINDQIFRSGDEIGRLKIDTANQDGVWVTHWKGRDFVALGGNFTLVTPATVSKPVGFSSL